MCLVFHTCTVHYHVNVFYEVMRLIGCVLFLDACLLLVLFVDLRYEV